MPVDQAAGLRRRGVLQPLPCTLCFFESADSTVHLAHALHQMGRECLLIDMQGRLFAASTTRSLFGWKRQLERGELQTLPQTYGKGWYAPGVQADEPALYGMTLAFDHVIFDAGWRGAALGLRPGVTHSVALEIQHTDESMRHAYALLKTLAHLGGASCVGLLGDAVACERVRTACCQFLEQRFVQALFSVAHEDDAFASLAVRMVDEETGLRAC